MQVSCVEDRAVFGRLERPWDALVGATPSQHQLFLRHAFVRMWIDNFAPRSQLHVLLAHGADGSLEAALPLMRRRGFVCGVPVRELTSTANAHSCRFDLLAADPVAAGKVFFERLAADRTWDVLRIRDVPEGGAAWALQAEFERAGFPVGAWPSLQSPYVPLPPSWEALAATLDAKFRANVRRRRRKLSERGEVAFERLDGGDGLQQALEVGFSLEAAGWKGERGTAIAQSPQTRGFYGELARWSAREQALALLFLRVGDRPVAFHYGLQTQGRYFLLKPGYDPAFRECSPGQLLMEEAIKDCIGRRVNEVDFLGPQMEWKRDWTPKVRPHAWLYVFRNNAFGRALRGAKFGLLPRAKKAVARWRH